MALTGVGTPGCCCKNFIYVNHRLRGNAPMTIAAMLGQAAGEYQLSTSPFWCLPAGTIATP